MRILVKLCIFLCCLTQVEAKDTDVTLVYASDLPVINSPDYGDYAELGTLLGEVRQAQPNPFFIFGGHSLAPSFMSSFDKGAHIIDILNSLEPDAMAVTKRELSYYEDEFSLRSYEAAFPMVLSNGFDTLTKTNLDGAYPHIMIARNGIKVGVIGVMEAAAVDEYLLQRLQITDGLKAIEQESANLRQQGADIIVLLHSQYEAYLGDILDRHVVDFALRTDRYDGLAGPSNYPPHPRRVLIKEAGKAALIKVHLGKEPKEMTSEIEILSLDDFAPQKDIQKQIQSYDNRFGSLLGEPLVVSEVAFNTYRKTVRTQESVFGNIVADALKKLSNADIGLINGGAIRGNREYAKGYQLTRHDIAEELPFDSRIVVAKVTGAQLIQALENGLSQVELAKGRFPHISGLRVEYDSDKPAGQRILSVRLDGRAIVADKTYRMATSDYLLQGGDGYKMFNDAELIAFTGQSTPLVSDVVVSFLRNREKTGINVGERLINRCSEACEL